MKFKILIKRLHNKLTKEEAIEFSEWYNSSKSHQDYFKKLKNSYGKEIDLVDVKKGWFSVQKRIKSKQIFSNYLKYGIAASLAVTVSISYYLYQQNIAVENNIANPQSKNQIFIGSDKAILTLNDGSNIALQKGNKHTLSNASSNGSEIIYSSNHQSTNTVVYNYLTIPRGGQFFVQLSDGTKVWLNSETKLKFPVNFIKNEVRKVELVYGEAYFDVSPSTEHNGYGFKVYQKNHEICVLGTEFNVKAYGDETKVYTTLVEGKVSIGKKNENKTILYPEQQFIYDLETHQNIVNTIDVKEETFWHKGVFYFKEKPLSEIMKVVSRWYDVEVIFKNKKLKDVKFKGVLNKNQNLETILKTMQNLSVIKNYNVDERKIILN